MIDQNHSNNVDYTGVIPLAGISAIVGGVVSESPAGAGVGIAAVMLGKSLQETYSYSKGDNYVLLELGAGLIGGAFGGTQGAAVAIALSFVFTHLGIVIVKGDDRRFEVNKDLDLMRQQRDEYAYKNLELKQEVLQYKGELSKCLAEGELTNNFIGECVDGDCSIN